MRIKTQTHALNLLKKTRKHVADYMNEILMHEDTTTISKFWMD